MALGLRSLALQADVGDLQDIDRMVRQTVETFGKVDILVNNAGVTRRASIMDLTEASRDRIHRVNAKGVFFCLQRVAREIIPRRSGRIVNMASIAGKGYAGTSNAAYAASKGAVISLTKIAAQQLGPPQHQRECHLPWSHADSPLRSQPARTGPGRGREHRGDGTPSDAGNPHWAGQ